MTPKLGVRETGSRPLVVIEGLDPEVEHDHAAIRLACRVEQDRVNEWANTRSRSKSPVSTLKELSRLYQTHEASPYKTVKFNTRKTYTQELGMIERTIGERKLSAIAAVDFTRWHREAAESVAGSSGLRKAQSIIKRLRAIVSFGVAAEVPECDRLDRILGKMRFKMPAPRDTMLTFEHAVAVIAKAHEMGRPSIALAQAIQFETGLRQSDVIGQWEPCEATDWSPYRLGKTRWTSGLVWQQLDAEQVLSMRTTKTGSPVTHALAAMPLVVAELARTPADKRIGPMIVSEATGMPYGPGIYAKTWRKIATAAGVPKSVWNRDTRAGAASEADEAGVEIGKIQRMVGHTTPKMTARYVRSADVVGSETIARLRAQKRSRNEA